SCASATESRPGGCIVKDGHADSQKELEHEIAMLRLRLEGAEEMWRAIAGAEIDGFVVGRDDEDRRVMLLEAAHPHFEEVLHRMQQGAVTVSRSGRILYANQRFATMVGELLPALFSTSLHDHITPA